VAVKLTKSEEQGHSTGNENLGEKATKVIDEALKRLDIVVPVQSFDELSLRSPPRSHRCIMLSNNTSPLFDRDDVFKQLDELLTADGNDSALQSVALHGLGGVGKTSIASSYAEKRYMQQVYDDVLWIASEKEVSLRQSFTDIAMQLQLPGMQPHSHGENHILVQKWFRTTGI
jgi:hypothetical protein